MQSERIVLKILIFIISINYLQSSSVYRQNPLGVLSEILGKDSKSPLVVVVDTSNFKAFDDEASQYDDRSVGADFLAADVINDALLRDNYQSVLYDILRSSNGTSDNVEERLAQETLIENALRQRCQIKVECEEKCSRSEERRPKRERYCQKSCKAVFDHLLKCPPPGNEKKRQEKKPSGCQSPKRGKTCPPSWRSF